MPKILEDRVKSIKKSNKNMDNSSAWAIATASLQKEGKLPKKRDTNDNKYKPKKTK